MIGAYAHLVITPPDVTATPPSPSVLTHAYVDSMATFFIVDSVDKLYKVTGKMQQCGRGWHVTT